MRRRALREGAPLVLSLVLWPWTAYADMAIPFAAGISVASAVLLVVVVLLEGAMIQHALRTTWRRALFASLVANLASTALGFALGLVSFVVVGAGLLLLPALFGGTVIVEAMIWRPLLGLTTGRAFQLSLGVNGASYVLVTIVAVQLMQYQGDRIRHARNLQRLHFNATLQDGGAAEK